jgi:hypothetical protein
MRHGILSSHAWDDIARTRTSLNIFPSLTRLSLNAWQESQLRDFVTLMQPGVKHLHIRLPAAIAPAKNTQVADPYSVFFKNIATRIPNLVSLDFAVFSDCPVTEMIENPLVEFISNLDRLERIVVPIYWLTSRVVSTLSRLPCLRVIQFENFKEQGYGSHLDCRPFTPSLEEDAFPKLKDLSLAVNLADMTKFLPHPFSPRGLTDMYIQTLDIEGSHALHELFAILPTSTPALVRLYMELRPRQRHANLEEEEDDLPFSYSPELLNDRITAATIRPLFACPALKHFEFTHDLPLRLSQDDVQELAEGFGSQLTSLLLNPEPFYLERPTLTLAALLPFAQHCPNLEHLHLYIDATRLSELPKPPPPCPLEDNRPWHTFSCQLQMLGFGVSPIEDPRAVARFLSALVTSPLDPSECTASSGKRYQAGIICGYTWDWYKDPPLSCPDPLTGEELALRFDNWKEVDRVLPLCCDLRREEGERTVRLLEEIRELRERIAVIEALR